MLCIIVLKRTYIVQKAYKSLNTINALTVTAVTPQGKGVVLYKLHNVNDFKGFKSKT